MSFKTYVLASFLLAGCFSAVRDAHADTLSSLNQLSNYTAYDPSGYTFVKGNIGYLGAIGADGSLTDSFTDVQGDIVSVQFIVTNDFGQPNDFSVKVDGVTLYAQYNLPSGYFDQPTISFVGTGSDTLAFLGQSVNYVTVQYPVASEAAPSTPVPVRTLAVGGVLNGSTTAVTPEPSSIALLGTGLLGMVAVVRRRFV